MSNETPIASEASEFDYHLTYGSLYLFSFGAYGSVQVYVWSARGVEAALEMAAEWCAEHAPGVFTEPDYDDAAREIGAPVASGRDADWRGDEEWSQKVAEHAETDLTYTESGYLASWEWGVVEINDAEEVAAVRARSREECGETDDE